ncbi:MAG: mannose-1-phosphate guanylyltransferase [bacterium]|nr:mannose-1-phosphate guanylyltransferase [bacterium]
MEKEKKHFGLILAGGQGTRFWPWSTEEKPKQFLEIVGDTPLITQTFNRLNEFIEKENIFVVADRKYLGLIMEAIPGFDEANFVDEPSPKNTAPCLILSNIALSQINEDANVAVVPADHYIPDTEKFASQLQEALSFADNKFIITSGIQPNMPHTGYGYIRFNENAPVTPGNTEFFDLVAFKEKPDLEAAKKYVAEGTYFWNSGMFFYNLKHFKSFLKEYSPYYYQQYIDLEKKYSDKVELEKAYNAIKPDSIDYALMEKVKEVKMFKAGFDWNDVGAWSSVYELNPKNNQGNVTTKENNIFIDSESSLIFSTDNKPIAVIGLKDIAVINTENGILISDLSQLQKVKQAVQKLGK